jgi:hypothetical protein
MHGYVFSVGYFGMTSVNRRTEDVGSDPFPLKFGFGPAWIKSVCRDRVATHKSNQARPRAYNADYISGGGPRVSQRFDVFHANLEFTSNPNPPTDR